MGRSLLPALLAGLGLLAASGALHGEPGPAPALRYDPFARPSFNARSGAGHADSDSGTAWRAELRATLVAGEDSVANLGGVMLRIGEEFEGYLLVEVREFDADFLRGDQTLTLVLEGEEAL